jgi:hypothetical protein
VIRVGADRESIPVDTPSGWDFEKYLYIPGIYDSVELVLCGSPRIVRPASTVRAATSKGPGAARIAGSLAATIRPFASAAASAT